MSDENAITVPMVRQFTDNVYFLYQQEGSRLRNFVRQQTSAAAEDVWDLVGATEAAKKPARHSKSPRMNTPHTQRIATLAEFEWWDLLDLGDSVRVLLDPKSAYAQAGAMALGRAVDQTIIDAFDGIAMAGEDGNAAVNFTSECAGDFNFSKGDFIIGSLLQIKKAFDSRDVPSDNRHIVLPAAGFTQLLGAPMDPQISNADYNKVKALVNGEIDEFLGFTFHRSSLLPSPSANVRYGFAWHQDSMGLSISEDISTSVMERPDYSNATQVLVTGNFGAVRIQGIGVTRFSIDELK